MCKSSIAVTTVVLFCVGCTYHLILNSSIAPGTVYENRQEGTYALYIPPDFSEHEIRAEIVSSDRSLSKLVNTSRYFFQVGPAASSAITNALRIAVDSLVITPSRPNHFEMDSLGLRGCFIPELRKCRITGEYNAVLNIFRGGRADASITLNYFDNMNSLRFSCTSSHGSDAIRRSFLESEATTWGHGLEAALAKISRDLAEEIVSSHEIRIQTRF